MNLWQALFPRFSCPRCGWEMTKIAGREDGGGFPWSPRVLANVLLTLAVVIALVLGVSASRLVALLAILGVLRAVVDRRLGLYRCPICTRVFSYRELTGTAREHPPDEPPRGPGADTPRKPS